MPLEDVILIFFRDLKTKLSKHNKKEIKSVHYIKIYEKGMLKNGFLYIETSDTTLLYQLRSKLLTHRRDFDLRKSQDILLLHIAWGMSFI